MFNQLLDKLIVLWIMPPLGFLITVLQTSELRYLNANYVVMAVLFGAIVFRWQLRAQPRRTILYLLLTMVMAAIFMGIEWLHFLAGRKTIDDLADLRMIIYSSFYGGIAIFVLYAIYLSTLDGGQRKSHLSFVVKMMCWFHLVFLAYWDLLYCGWIEAIPKADLLHSNSVAYGALFVLCVMLLYRQTIELSQDVFGVFLVVNIAVIFVNETRGAIIALAAIVLYFLVEASGIRWRGVLTKLMLGALLGIGVVVALAGETLLTRVVGKDINSLGAVLDQISDSYERKAEYVSVNPDLVSDESLLSAFSRIGSNYYSLLSFLDNPLMGIGQGESYSIKVLGSGVHSHHFLMANATGILGMALFAAILAAIVRAQDPPATTARFIAILILFFGYVLVFLNSIPIYFALIVTVLAKHRQTRLVRATGYPAGREYQHLPNWELSSGK